MTARVTFTQAQIARAIKAAKSAGMKVSRCEITPDGHILLTEAGETEPQTALEKWRAKHGDRDARPS